MSELFDTATIELMRLSGATVHCCHPDCDMPASFAHISPNRPQPANVRLYEMQPYCARHYVEAEQNIARDVARTRKRMGR